MLEFDDDMQTFKHLRICLCSPEALEGRLEGYSGRLDVVSDML